MKSEEIINLLHEFHYDFVTGVPDSIFKDFLIKLWQSKQFKHIISANEGEACALGAGYHLSTRKTPVIYLQNSGLGNAINPLTSLLDSYIYSIPALLLISWRGMPGEHDEPQHQRMGEILCPLLEILNIPYRVIETEKSSLSEALKEAQHHFINKSSPFALVFRRKSIEADADTKPLMSPIETSVSREQVIELITQHMLPTDVLISTTGKTSRELFEMRVRNHQSNEQDFLTVGSMGCSSAIALGVALSKPEQRVILLDGDGACLMRMENMATIGHYSPENLAHLLVDNHAHESTGGQPTLADTVDFAQVASACGYKSACGIQSTDLPQLLKSKINGPILYRLLVNTNSRDNLGRPTKTPFENKKDFMNFISDNPCKPLS